MNESRQKNITRIIQSLIILLPGLVFVWLINIDLVPAGVFETTRAVNERSPYIDQVLPDARVEAPQQLSNAEWSQKIIGDPAFFFVHPQRFFDQVETEIRFKNSNLPIVELGILADATTGAYALEPLQNLLIDNSKWSRLVSDDIILLQRNPKFETVEDFLRQPPARSEIATYHYGLTEPYRLSGYTPTSIQTVLNVSLRGSHEFYTYIKNEDLNFVFAFMDMNRLVGEDTVTLIAIDETGKSVAEIRAQDDGNTLNDSKALGLRQLTLKATALPEGVYKIQMKASEDIFFRSIATTQQKITFLNQIWLADQVGFSEQNRTTDFVTEGKNLKLATRHASGAQTITIGRGSVAILEPYIEYEYAPPEAGLVKVNVPKSEDLLISSDGHLAFSQAQYFNPDPVRLTAESDLDRLNVNYLIAKYIPPVQDGEWLLARVKFATSNVSFEDKTWKFVLSLPTITQPDRQFFLNSVTMKFTRPKTTWNEVWGKFKEYVF
ncbi:MAG: hypothetical protein UX09_C0002G0021 [Candidatus Uhrbacteria bacterium GW2011_GWE2_45_35]|uniref:Uncharacterized protein n=2 Tax=Candidatus Uhriibacteriota TaxID=1752732 RepID=A0A0G1JKQ2_9BACT|nr:MAG: hypothetical protein UW63_C0004G0004 [Candidatus Uhrbacteria bacterium GW2011_GWF2_44_350]KKU09178.1 MAG: hypothetical protein UX09_C0002G0021 [Candidatus Uhrbacteria bacterium GW2011_GWE2_45_35]HBR80109.1 hypothetical protein [Candidatus Uhrbacteria bacterium]HCU31211.1 hypothetical protein [Candidatus Uhrbacteria bacterium]